jgi:hypothetical protein
MKINTQHREVLFFVHEVEANTLVIKAINRSACNFLARDILKLPDEVLGENFWEMYQLWQSRAEGPLCELWADHLEDYPTGVIFEFHDLLELELQEFQKLTVAELKNRLPVDGKFQVILQKIAA